MDMGDISRLAHYLRDNGDPILNAGAKLTLSTDLLHDLNEAFPMLVDSENHNDPFRVISANGSSLDIFHELAFVHDFIQRTESLKVVSFPKIQTLNSIDISKFTILTTLELNKIPVEIVTGLHNLSSQLETLICTRCFGNLEDILHCSSTQNETSSEWCNLRRVVLSFNGLQSIDRFVHYVPWVQVLDLSHNHLTNANAIKCLPNLKCLNLSYNFLLSLPPFNEAASERLISLQVKFNHLENIEGLFGLNSLQDLDLTCNCISDHRRCLSSLVGLSSLCTLWLCGNPLSFHKKHRKHTAQLLHINTIHREFTLDGQTLSKTEQSVIGSRSIDSQSLSVESSTSHSQVDDTSILYQPQKSQTSRRSGRVRDAVISDYQEFEVVSQINDSKLACSLDTSTEHLETKKQIEILRQKFGEENWLHSQSGSCIQSILGLPQSPKPGVLSIIASLQDSKETIGHVIENASHREPNPDKVVDTRTPQKSDTGHVLSDSPQDTVVELDQVFSSKDTCPEEQESEMSEDEGTGAEEYVYTVQRDSIELFLVITKFHIRERDITFGKTIEKWSVSSLLSCVLIGSNPFCVQCKYDSFRRERQTRIYFMAEEDAQKIVKELGKILEARSLQDMDQKVHRCLNCFSQFTRELNFWDARNRTNCACPNCKSLLVVEMEEVPLPHKLCDNNNTKKQSVEAAVPPLHSSSLENMHSLAQSPSKSSIGDAARSSVCNPDLIQTVAFIHSTDDADATYNSTTIATPARSAASLDHSPDWSTSAGETVVQRSDSDIEVISNPSQSSIEVIEEKGTPVRKRSKEPAVENAFVPPPVQATLGLTESSSSDSFTESVCTTYENRSFSSLPKGNSIHHTDVKNDGSISEENEIDDMLKNSTILETTLYLGNDSLEANDHKITIANMSKGSINTLYSNVLEEPLKCSDGIEKIAGREHDSAVEYSYVDYTLVDHRVKLHLYLQVFMDEGEELILLIRAHILQKLHSNGYPGCVAFSNRNIYFLEVIGQEGDDPDKWLNTTSSFPMKKMTGIFGLPWNQGICLKYNSPNAAIGDSCLLLLKDQQRTLNLVKFMSDLPLPVQCRFTEYQSPSPADYLIGELNSRDGHSHSCSLVTIFNYCKILSDQMVCSYLLGALIITESDLIISKSSLLWMTPNSKQKVNIVAIQKISNLLAVEVTIDAGLIELHFLDETVDKDEVWCLTLETEDCQREIITVLQPPWEKMFSVPLEIKVNS